MKWKLYQKGPDTASNTQYFARVPDMHSSSDLQTRDLRPLEEIEVSPEREAKVLEFINTFRGPEGVFRQGLLKVLEGVDDSNLN